MPQATPSAGGPALQAAQALALWHRVLVVGLNRSLPDLTTRQFALVLEVYLAPPPHTVRGLAKTLHMSKPAVTRAVDRLEKLEFVRRKTDEKDKRSAKSLGAQGYITKPIRLSNLEPSIQPIETIKVSRENEQVKLIAR